MTTSTQPDTAFAMQRLLVEPFDAWHIILVCSVKSHRHTYNNDTSSAPSHLLLS